MDIAFEMIWSRDTGVNKPVMGTCHIFKFSDKSERLDALNKEETEHLYFLTEQSGR